MRNLSTVFATIDEVNATDPNRLGEKPLALAQGQSASTWLGKLSPDAGPELQLAVRAHHLRRWELKRADYPEGRAGYLKWRRDNKAHQANALSSLMDADGWSAESICQARTLLGRTKLKTDPETQTLEDAACLVFIESQFDDMTDRLDHDHMVSVVSKTLKKMSDAAITLAGSIALSDASQAVLSDAVATLHCQDD